ncbi:MAG: hypothetical protein AAFV33_20120, partial [Chloroflexota bacterium]
LVTDDLTTPTVLIAFAIYALGLAFAATNHLQDRASVKEDMYLIVRTRSIRLMMFLFIFYVPASIHLAIISNSAVFVAIAIFSAGTALYMRRQLIMSTDKHDILKAMQQHFQQRDESWNQTILAMAEEDSDRGKFITSWVRSERQLRFLIIILTVLIEIPLIWSLVSFVYDPSEVFLLIFLVTLLVVLVVFGMRWVNRNRIFSQFVRFTTYKCHVTMSLFVALAIFVFLLLWSTEEFRPAIESYGIALIFAIPPLLVVWLAARRIPRIRKLREMLN